MPTGPSADQLPTGRGAVVAAWTIALDGYLTRLRTAWGDRPDVQVSGLLAGIGLAADPSDVDRRAFQHAASGPPDPISAGLGLGPGEALTIAAVWAAETDPQFAVALGCAHDDAGRRYPSAALLRLLAAPFGVDLPPAWTPGDPLIRCGVLMPAAGPWAPLSFTPAARAVLCGHWPPSDDADPRHLPERLADLVAQLAPHLDTYRIVLVRGAFAAGLAAAVVHAAGRVPVTQPLPEPHLRLLARLRVGVPVQPVTDPPTGWADADGPWLAYGEPGDTLDGALPVDVPPPDAAQRVRAWVSALSAAGVSNMDLAKRLGDGYRYGEDTIEAAVARAVTTARWTGRAPTADDVWAAAQRHPAPRRPGQHRGLSAEPPYTRDDTWRPATLGG